MTMVFERIQTDGIAQLSYLVGDDGTQTAAVVDPRPDIDVYLELSRQKGVAITDILETHIHADFMSGARELGRQLGIETVHVSGEGEASYDFPVQKIFDGDQFRFGSVTLTTRHTPGHTPEHVSYELAESDNPDRPWGVLSGDSLFVGSAGRPDLLGEEETEQLTEDLFRTLREYYLKLDDGVIIYPCHGAGSACGADIGERPMTTIGYEKKTNDFLKYEDFESFKKFIKEGAPPVPQHYPILKRVNANGPGILGRAPVLPGLPPEDFQEVMQDGTAQIVDTRQMLSFGGGYPKGAINIGDRPEMSVWAGDILSYEKPILLIVEDESHLDWIGWHFAYVGLTKFRGYLAGGMKAWSNQGLPMESLPQITVQELAERQNELQILDVRSKSEFQKGRIAGAKHKYVAEMRDGIDGNLGLDPERPVAVYCGSGYRASIAASLMKRHGFQEVYNVPGSMEAWKILGFEIEK